MSRLTIEEGLILNLRGKIPKGSVEYLTSDNAYALLKRYTNQDFGYDANEWKKWIEENGLPELGILPKKEFNNAVLAALEYQDQGFTERKCLRCGGEFVISINGHSYHVHCANNDFSKDWTSP